MSGFITVGLDLAKNVFQVHGADSSGRALLPSRPGHIIRAGRLKQVVRR
jgi:hypothetical protein